MPGVRSTVPPSPSRSSGKKKSRWAGWLAVLLFAAAIVMVFVWSSLGRQPEFYRTAMQRAQTEMDQAGDAFEKRSLDWVNQTKRIGSWSASFTSDQINGWLATDFVTKFPGSLPPGLSDPRIDMRPEEFVLAVKWRWSIFRGVAVIRADVFCTSTPGEIAVRFKGARTGVLSLPIRSIGDAIANGLRNSGYSVQWSNYQGDPLLIVVPPARYREHDRALVTIKSITVGDSELKISGDTVVR